MTAVTGSDGERYESPLLVLAPTRKTRDNDAFCRSLLVGPPEESKGVVAVTLDESASTYVERWTDSGTSFPAELGLVSAGGEAASVEEATTVEMIASPGDLTSLGMAISDVLERLHGEVDSLSVCIDSVTVLLQYADQQRVFRFLHTINRRFELVGAAVHIHLDPVTQNDRVVATFATLAKSVVRYENGEWTRAR